MEHRGCACKPSHACLHKTVHSCGQLPCCMQHVWTAARLPDTSSRMKEPTSSCGLEPPVGHDHRTPPDGTELHHPQFADGLLLPCMNSANHSLLLACCSCSPCRTCSGTTTLLGRPEACLRHSIASCQHGCACCLCAEIEQIFCTPTCQHSPLLTPAGVIRSLQLQL